MRRGAFGSLVLAAAVTLFALLASSPPPRAQAACTVVCITPTPTPTPTPTVNPDGSLIVSNPSNLQPLGAMTAGQPIYPRVGSDGHLYFGWNVNSIGDANLATPDQVAQMAAALGASFVRFDLPWPQIEPTDHGYQWSYPDARYRAFVAHGIRPLWTLMQTPNFAVGADKSTCSNTAWRVANLYCTAEPDATHRANLHDVAAALAARYPLSAGFEYRNEPNLDASGKCTAPGSWRIDPVTYSTDLQSFASGARSTRPDTRILGGALSNCGGRYASYAAAMLDAGAGASMSALSWHPYDETAGFSQFGPELAAMESAVSAHGGSALRMVAGEVGVSLGSLSDANRSTRLQSQYTQLGGSLGQGYRYDAFVGFNDVENPNTAGYGWVAAKDRTNAYQARAPFCGFRSLLHSTVALPSFMRDCVTLP